MYTIGMIYKKYALKLNLSTSELESMQKICTEKSLSKTALIRRALKLYEILDKHTTEGSKIYIRTEDLNKEIELLL